MLYEVKYMNLSEKIERISGLKNRQKELREKLVMAKEQGNIEQQKSLEEEINKIIEEIKDINGKYNEQRASKTQEEKIEDNITSFSNRGDFINNNISKYNDMLKGDISGEQKEEILNYIQDLEKQKTRLGAEMYSYAIQKSELDYENGERYPEQAKKKYTGILNNLKKQRQNLESEKEKRVEFIEKRKDDIKQQFNIATQKYKEMLESGKISQELYDSRIESMENAKNKDLEMLNNSLGEFDKKLEDNQKELDNINKKIEVLKQKEKIYNEYNDVYYKIFGESMNSFSRQRTKAIKNGLESVKEPSSSNLNNAQEDIEEENSPVENTTQVNSQNKSSFSNSSSAQGQPLKDEQDEQEESPIVITSKKMFNDIYSKLSRGKISDAELKSLTEVLTNEQNYDKYGITTGLVFNKARKILKAQGSKTAKDIDKFLQLSNSFSDDIKFDSSIEDKHIVSHDMLNSWKDVENNLNKPNSVLSVEKYIEQIEQYKKAGNQLTSEQEKMYNDAIQMKENIVTYRKALDINKHVTQDRNNRNRNSVFSKMFGKKDEVRSLSQAQPESNDPGFITREQNLDLSSMVYSPEAEEVNYQDARNVSPVDRGTRDR